MTNTYAPADVLRLGEALDVKFTQWQVDHLLHILNEPAAALQAIRYSPSRELLGYMRTVAICPECRSAKHGNCDGTAMDERADEIVECRCPPAFHPEKRS